MTVGMQVSGSAIERVFNQPIVPPRRFRGAIDAALTLALGSVCAFALTLGPAPLNTVAVSSAAAASFAGSFDPAPETLFLPAEVGADDSEEKQSGSRRPAPAPSERVHDDAVKQSPAAASPPSAPPGATKRAEKVPVPPVPDAAAVSQGVTASAALTIVETFRLASGLMPFVSADACEQPTVHFTVPVAPTGVLAPTLGTTSLAPDPAFATVSGEAGSFFVTVHACR